MEIHSSFQSMSEADFNVYSLALVNGYPTSAQRKHALAYLQHVNSADKSTHEAEKDGLRKKRLDRSKKQKIIDDLIENHKFDFTRQADLFAPQVVTDSEIAILLGGNNSEVYIPTRSMMGNVLISGDNVLFDGQGNNGSARTGSLENTATIVGQLQISGSGTIVRGIDFTSTSENALIFTGPCENLTLEDCKFTAGVGITDSVWWFGEDDYFQGDVTVTNCRVEGFNSWMLADFHTGSATPTIPLKKVRINKCFFKNNAGSIATRGMVSDPIKLFEAKDNKFEASNFHTLFWDFLECNNVLKIVATGNEMIGEPGTDTTPGKKGGFQFWSRSPRPWTLKFANNSMTNLKVGLKIATNNTFYSPDVFNEDQFGISLDGEVTDVAYAASFVYKKNDGSTTSVNKWQFGDYSPVNLDTYPMYTGLSVVNPSGFAIVQPS
jgi:hypothetical protein